MIIKDKIIIVTGGSEGLGKAISEKLVAKGAQVVNISRKSEKYPCDITDKVQVTETVRKIVKDFSRIDGLINAAGVWQKTKAHEEISLNEIELVLDTNLKGLIYVTNTVLPHLKRTKEAVLVNISSKSGTRPMDLQTVYCASKYGVKGFTDTLKLELKGTPVKVLGLYPSGMNTKMFAKTGEDFPASTFMDVNEIAEIVTFAIERPGNISIEEIQIEKY